MGTPQCQINLRNRKAITGDARRPEVPVGAKPLYEQPAPPRESQKLVTHIRPSCDGDPLCYAYQVCAFDHEDAQPVYQAAEHRLETLVPQGVEAAPDIFSAPPLAQTAVERARISGFAEGIERAAKIAEEHAADFERQADGKEDPHAHDALLLAADACELTADAIRAVMGGEHDA